MTKKHPKNIYYLIKIFAMICGGESGLNLEKGGKECGNKKEKVPFKTHNDGSFNVMYDSGAYGSWRAYESRGYDYAECGS